MEKCWDFGIGENRNHKISFIQKQKINAEFLVLGPCEPLWMISPKILAKNTGLKIYNLASSHSDFSENYLSLYIYLKNNAAPKYLLLYVTPESFDSNYNTFNTFRFTSLVHDTVINKVVKENDPDYNQVCKIPFMRHAYYNRYTNFMALQGIKHWYTDRSIPYFEDGYEPPSEILWDNHLDWFKEYFPKGYQFNIEPKRVKYLNKIVELCKEKNITPIFYESPVLKESIKYQGNREEIMVTIRTMAKQHQVEYLVFDGMKIAEEKSNFISVLVLNKSNSEVFCDTLGKKLNEIIINTNKK